MPDAEPIGLVQVAGFFGHDEGADSLRAFPGIGHGSHDEDLTNTTVSDEDLAAVQDVVCTLAYSSRLGIRCVAAGAGFS